MQQTGCAPVPRIQQQLYRIPWACRLSTNPSPRSAKQRQASRADDPILPPQQQQQPQPQQSADSDWRQSRTEALQQQPAQEQQQGTSRVSMWDYKPPWCQPWSILLTGSGVVAGSWQFAHSLWLTLPLALGVAAWWGLFLVVAPASFAQYVEAAEQRGIDWRREMLGEE